MFKDRDKNRSSAPVFEARKHYIFEVPFDQLTDSSVVCTCANITYADFKNELQFGFETVDEILADLEAGDTCRKCVSYLNLLLDHAKKELGMA